METKNNIPSSRLDAARNEDRLDLSARRCEQAASDERSLRTIYKLPLAITAKALFCALLPTSLRLTDISAKQNN